MSACEKLAGSGGGAALQRDDQGASTKSLAARCPRQATETEQKPAGAAPVLDGLEAAGGTSVEGDPALLSRTQEGRAFQQRGVLELFAKRGALRHAGVPEEAKAEAAVATQPQLRTASGARRFPRWQVHRGFLDDGQQVENTLGALQAAKAQGQGMVEIDVRLSHDRVAVVFHDRDLKRLHGVDRAVAEATAEELQAYDIPTLLDVLRDPGVTEFINAELKPASPDDALLEQAVIEAIAEAGAEDRVLLSSFDPVALGRAAALAPQLPRALLTAKGEQESDAQFIARIQRPLRQAQTDVLSLYHATVSPSLAQALAAHGLRFMVWTVNDPARARALLELGAVGVISDNVEQPG